MSIDSRATTTQTDPTEVLLALARQELGQEDLGPDDDMFSLGLSSLQITALRDAVLERFGVCLEIEDVFLNSTPAALAALVTELAPAPTSSSVPEPLPAAVSGPARYPASAAQARMYVMHAMDPAATGYNLPEAVVLEGPVTSARIEEAIRTMHLRHEALHTRFELVGTDIVQIVDPSMPAQIVHGQADPSQVPALFGEFVAPFDLSSEPPYRVLILETGVDLHHVIIDVHHIAADGWSMTLYVEEIFRLLEGEELAPLALQYKDFALWEAGEVADTAKMAAACEAVTRRSELGPVVPITLPTDRPRPAQQDHTGARIVRNIPTDILQDASRVAGAHNATAHMLFLTGFFAVLSRWSGQFDLTVGSPNAGRPRREFRPVFGMFVNMSVNRCRFAADTTFAELLAEVRRTCLTTLAHAEVPFDAVVAHSQVARPEDRHPLFDYVFAYQNIDMPDMRTEHLRASLTEFDYRISRFDMFLSLLEVGGEVRAELEYASRLFDPVTAEAFLDDFFDAVSLILTRPDAPVTDLPGRRSKVTAPTLAAPDFAL